MRKRMLRKRNLAVLAAAIFILTTAASAADWPQFQGPTRDGKSAETGLARQWPADGPKALWTIPLGEGYGAPAIVDGKVYILDRVNNQQDVLRCLALDTGKELWTFAYDAPGKLAYNGSRSTPTVDEKFIFTIGPFGDFHCIDKATHKPVWKKRLMQDFDGSLPKWGFSQSAVLYKNWVIAAPQSKKTAVVAFEKTTGKIAWQSPPMTGDAGYVTPGIVTLDGVEQIVMFTSKRVDERGGKEYPEAQVAGIDINNGSFLWTSNALQPKRSIATPVAVGDDRLFITGGYGAGSAMIRVKRQDGKFKPEIVFSTQLCGAQIHQPILHKGHLFIGSNSNSRRDGLLCLTLDGKIKWQTTKSHKLPNFVSGLPGFGRGNLIIADDMIFMLEGDKSNLRLLEASPEGYTELGSATGLFTGRNSWANLALSDGKLLARDQEKMTCFDVSRP